MLFRSCSGILSTIRYLSNVAVKKSYKKIVYKDACCFFAFLYVSLRNLITTYITSLSYVE